jgi:ferredoxin
MPKLTIDNRDVEVPPGATVLDAARKLGIDIPALCFRPGCDPATSCLVCMVKLGHNQRLAPSCGTAAAEGMVVESETEEVHRVRRSALELLLSDHLGDCVAPCMFGCPAGMDIPKMLRQIAAGDLPGAIATVKADIALPAVLGRICPAPCEKVCRRTGLDGAVAICLLKRFVADMDLASGQPYLPPCRPASGKRVAIVGAGPAGLAAAYYLAQQGHACTVFDEGDKPGGRLWRETTAENLPRDVLEAEITTITRLGTEMKLGIRVGRDVPFAESQQRFDAVLVACGATAAGQAASWGLKTDPRGIAADKTTFATSLPGVFAAGCAVRGKAMVVRSVADGKEAAVSIGQFLAGEPVTGPASPFSTKIGRMEGEELVQFSAGTAKAARSDPAAGTADGFAAEEAAGQAARCMHCDCRGATSCRLRHYAALYGADPRRFKAERRRFQQDLQHADVVFEPGKCIDCGLCIQIAAAEGEPIGLTLIGRGFDVRVGPPLGRSLAEALQKVAARCIEACPTAALAWKNEREA